MRLALRSLWWAFGIALGVMPLACDLNPQPEVPGADESDDENGAAGAPATAPPSEYGDPNGRSESDDDGSDPNAGAGSSKNNGSFAGGNTDTNRPVPDPEPERPPPDDDQPDAGGRDAGAVPPSVVR